MAEFLTGDFEILRNWAEIAGRSDRVLMAASEAIADEALALIDEGFERERDPYGEAWAPKQRNDGRRVLQGESGELRSGWHKEEVGHEGFMLSASVEYAQAHQRPRRGNGGRLKRPQRMMVPNERGLPAAWSNAFERIAQEVLDAHFEGRAANRRLTVRVG